MIDRGAPNNWTFLGPVLLAFHQEGKIEDDRWAAFIEDLRTHPFTHCLGAAWGPIQVNSTQRREAAAEFKSIPTAIITNHPVSRGIVTAVGWLGMRVRGYRWGAVHEAAKYLSPPGIDLDELEAAFENLVGESLPLEALAELENSE